MKGWKGDSLRHSLAARGIKTSGLNKHKSKAIPSSRIAFVEESILNGNKLLSDIMREGEDRPGIGRRVPSIPNTVRIQSAHIYALSDYREGDLGSIASEKNARIALRMRDIMLRLDRLKPRSTDSTDVKDEMWEKFDRGILAARKDFENESDRSFSVVDSYRVQIESKLTEVQIAQLQDKTLASQRAEYRLLGVLAYTYSYLLFHEKFFSSGSKSTLDFVQEQAVNFKSLVKNPKVFKEGEFVFDYTTNGESFDGLERDVRERRAAATILFQIRNIKSSDQEVTNEEERLAEALKIQQRFIPITSGTTMYEKIPEPDTIKTSAKEKREDNITFNTVGNAEVGLTQTLDRNFAGEKNSFVNQYQKAIGFDQENSEDIRKVFDVRNKGFIAVKNVYNSKDEGAKRLLANIAYVRPKEFGDYLRNDDNFTGSGTSRKFKWDEFLAFANPLFKEWQSTSQPKAKRKFTESENERFRMQALKQFNPDEYERQAKARIESADAARIKKQAIEQADNRKLLAELERGIAQPSGTGGAGGIRRRPRR